MAGGHFDAPWMLKERAGLLDQISWIQKKNRGIKNDIEDLENKVDWIQEKSDDLKERILGDKIELIQVAAKIEEINDTIGSIEEDKKDILRRLNKLSDRIAEKNNQIRRIKF